MEPCELLERVAVVEAKLEIMYARHEITEAIFVVFVFMVLSALAAVAFLVVKRSV